MDGVFLRRENRILVRMLVSRRFPPTPPALHPWARLTPTEREAAFNINANRSRNTGLSVLCMNSDSSLQVGRTWRGGPCRKSAATPPRSPEVPVKSASVANFTLRGQSCEQPRAHHSHFHSGFLNPQTPFYGIFSTF